MTAWKRLELRIARALGGERRGPTGRDLSDVSDDVPFSVEIKRTTRPRLPGAWIDQARRHSKLEGKPWIIVQATHNSPRPLVTMEFELLLRLLGRSAFCVLCGAPTTGSYCQAHADLAGDGSGERFE